LDYLLLSDSSFLFKLICGFVILKNCYAFLSSSDLTVEDFCYLAVSCGRRNTKTYLTGFTGFNGSTAPGRQATSCPSCKSCPKTLVTQYSENPIILELKLRDTLVL